MEHVQSQWCWCRPRLENIGWTMVVVHHDVEAETLSSRKYAGGEEYDSTGEAAEWRHLIP